MSLNKIALICVLGTVAGACTPRSGELGAPTNGFGASMEMNHLVQVGYVNTGALYNRYADNFAANVPDTVNFPFNSTRLTAEARAVLDAQFAWLQANRAARLQLAGHTDLVGGEDYNLRLGLGRAEAVATYLVSRGIDRNRLDTISTFGESQPVVATTAPSRANRRVVTTVAGVSSGLAGGFDGRRADIIYTNYATRGGDITDE